MNQLTEEHENDNKRPERVWITWDDCYAWETPETGGDEYARVSVVGTWSKESPKVDGVYWWRADRADSDPDIHRVVDGIFFEVGEQFSRVVEGFGGEWLGPIFPDVVPAAASPAAPHVPRSNLEPHAYQPHPRYAEYCAFAVGDEDYCKRESNHAIHNAPVAPQEDAQPATSEHRWRCACGWAGTPSQMTVSNDLRTCPRCGTSGGLILDATLTPQQTCEHGIAWSMECLSCGPSDYVAVAAPTPSQRARDTAKELQSRGLLWSNQANVELGGEPFDEEAQIEEVAAIISRYFPAAAETVGEREQ